MMRTLALLMLAAMALAGCTTAEILDCRAANGLTPDCRFENPEDFAVSPAGTALFCWAYAKGRGGKF
ncbi:MAG: hypothetical protein EBV76_05395, partial [Gammaproteobacteria bacterium]|nr:hypothetical protein [Gammaproteobacteria bacterium]